MSELTPREQSAISALNIVTKAYDKLQEDYDKLLADHNKIKEQLATMTDKINKLKESYKSDIVLVEDTDTNNLEQSRSSNELVKKYRPLVKKRLLTQKDANDIRNAYRNNISIKELYKKYNVNRTVVKYILDGRTYRSE